MALAVRGPSGLPSFARAQGRDSLSDPLVGFSPPSWFVPKSPPHVSRRRHLSWGSFAPTAFEEERVHVRPVVSRLQVRPPRCYQGGLPAVPLPPATVPPAGFPNLSAACSSPVRPAIFRRVTLLGFSLQGFVPHAEASTGSSPVTYPLDVVPAGCASPRPRRGRPRARCPLPRMLGAAPLGVFRVFVLA